MEKIIKKLLCDKKSLIEKIEQVETKNINCSYSISEFACQKWSNIKGIDIKEAFISLLAKWVNIQNTVFRKIYAKNSDVKKPEDLLSKLFGTEDFSNLNVEKVEDSDILDKIKAEMIWNDTKEQYRIKEIRSFSKAKVIKIYSMQDKGVFFGKCTSPL